MNDLFNILQDLPLDNKIFIRSCVDKLERDIPGNLQGLDRAIESEGVENVYVPAFLARDKFYKLLLQAFKTHLQTLEDKHPESLGSQLRVIRQASNRLDHRIEQQEQQNHR